MNVLFVVAHPDDEVLGAGATIRKMADRGDQIDVVGTPRSIRTVSPKQIGSSASGRSTSESGVIRR